MRSINKGGCGNKKLLACVLMHVCQGCMKYEWWTPGESMPRGSTQIHRRVGLLPSVFVKKQITARQLTLTYSISIASAN